MIEINTQGGIYSVIFTADGQHLLSAGSEAKVQRWRVNGGSEAGEPIQIPGTQIFATALSPDGKWLVCGLYSGALNVRVWDAQTHKQVLWIKDHGAVYSIDISHDSTKFAAGGHDKSAFIWSMITGEKVVGPLQHESPVMAVRFSPDGDRIATAAAESNGPNSIRIWNSTNGQRLLDIPFLLVGQLSSYLAWSSDGSQLYAASNKTGEVSRFDASSGSLLSKWSFPGGGSTASIVLSRSQKFAVVAASKTMSFWDTSTYTQIGNAIEHQSLVYSISLSPDDESIATGEGNGKVTIRNLRDILHPSYFTANVSDELFGGARSNQSLPPPPFSSHLPFVHINDAACKSWMKGNLTCAEELLTEEISLPSDIVHQAHALATRSLVRTQLGHHVAAIDDAKASIGAQRSLIGCIAHAMARLRNGEHDPALRAYDLVFSEGLATENNCLLLIRAIILFECAKREDAISRSESEFKELVSSMTEALDDALILRVVAKYFQYVTFSHVWQGKEPSYQDVNAVQSVWKLDSSPLNEKLKGFCEVVRTDGYRWAWSDTCCIDKTISTVLNQSLVMMYKWYESSAATLILLTTADSPSVLGALTDSLWMTRAWTAQELLAAKVVRFYDRNWKLYLGDTRRNHKESPEIMQELAKVIGIPEKTISVFNPDDLGVREKLRVASTRNATVEEDMAYSLIGIFQSDIIPRYGEGDAALGHLLEEIVARSGEVTVLDWTGRSSSYNSCLPTNLTVYSRPPSALGVFNDSEMDMRVGELRSSLSQANATQIHDRITRLSPARFANRRLHLPCVYFPVKRLGVQGNNYRARVSGIGYVEFQGSDRFPLNEPRKLIFVHPWISNLRDPLVGFSWGSILDDEDDSDRDTETESAPSSPLQTVPGTAIDGYTRALRLVARLQQPFHALLLQQQPGGEFRRIVTEHEIVIPGIERQVNSAKDIRVGTVEIL